MFASDVRGFASNSASACASNSACASTSASCVTATSSSSKTSAVCLESENISGVTLIKRDRSVFILCSTIRESTRYIWNV